MIFIVCLDPSMVHPSALSPPVFRSSERHWEESVVPPSNSQSSAHICFNKKQQQQQFELVRVPFHYYIHINRFYLT